MTSLDFNVSKTFKFTERHAVDLRAEFINLANHPILNAPNTGVGPQLGLLNSSNYLSGREVQFAVKYHF